ncbi:MAG: hypothetical protein ACYC96_01690 [Fimbriimonadaceae bacterium]
MAVRKAWGVICGAAVVATSYGQTYITFNGHYGPDDVINVSYNVGAEHLSDRGVVAGFLQFNDDSHQNGLSNPFETLCGDIFHGITGGDKYLDTIYQTDSFASTGAYVSAYTSATAVQAAGNIVGKDFDTVYSARSADEAAGLQIAIWATLYDTAYSSQSASTFDSMLTNFNSTNGKFQVSGLGSHQASILGDAYSYWKDQALPVSNALFLLHGPTGFQGQDQFTTTDHYHPSSTPEPFTLALGLAGAALAIRRRTAMGVRTL